MKEFFVSNLNPIFNENRDCVCLHCSSLLCEGTISNHQKHYCPNLKNENNIQTFHTIWLIICTDDQVLMLQKTVFNLIKMSKAKILPITFVVERNNKLTDDIIEDIKTRFSLLQWMSLNCFWNVLILSSFKYSYVSTNMNDMTKILRTFLDLLKSSNTSNSPNKNEIVGFFADFQPNDDPIFQDMQKSWPYQGFYTIDNFLPWVCNYLFSSLITLKSSNNETTWINSKTFRPFQEFKPMKLSSFVLKRAAYCDVCKSLINSRTKQLCSVKNVPCQKKMTPCYYCNKFFALNDMKKHEKNCKHRYNDFTNSDFIVILGDIRNVSGQSDLRCLTFATLLHHYYPRAFISKITATDLVDFYSKYNACSFHHVKYFGNNFGKILIFLFVHEYPRFKILSPLINSNQIFHLHYDFVHCYHRFTAPFDSDEITPNTSLSIYNDPAKFAHFLGMIHLCNHNDAAYLSNDFSPSLTFPFLLTSSAFPTSSTSSTSPTSSTSSTSPTSSTFSTSPTSTIRQSSYLNKTIPKSIVNNFAQKTHKRLPTPPDKKKIWCKVVHTPKRYDPYLRQKVYCLETDPDRTDTENVSFEEYDSIIGRLLKNPNEIILWDEIDPEEEAEYERAIMS